MPRGRGQQSNQETNQKAQRVARLRNVTPPNSNVNHNKTMENLSTEDRHFSSTNNLTNSTLETQATEMSSSRLTPLLVGATNSIAGNTSSVGFEQNGNAGSTSLKDTVQRQSDNFSLISDSKVEVGANFSEAGHFPSFLPSVSKDLQRPVGFSSLLANWGKKVEGLPVMDSSAFSPSWIQTCEKAGLSKAAAASQSLIEYSSKDSVNEIKQLKDEVNSEKAAKILIEQQLDDERQQRELVEQELENTRNAKQEVERRLHISEQRTNELQATLATAQQALEEYHNSNGSSDWVLYRDEILLSDKVIGVGGWGKVMEGIFRGCKVAVKQIHELILSPHNSRLFEREMSIASRCRHPCLLQFIGATSDDDQSPLFVTELLDTSLRAVLQERALEPTEITTIALDVAKGLNYLHLNHPAPIIHRDISSANVLLWKHSTCWRAKVSDYGTANFMQYSMTASPGAVIYSAPEAQTSRQSPKVDAYSFGVLLCEMNIREFPDVTYRNEQVAMVTNNFSRDLIRRCLQQDPEERPAMAKIINLLENQQ